MLVDEFFWPYLAGFFDGEGSISFISHGPILTLAQSGDRGKILMEELRDALQGELQKNNIRGTLTVLAWTPNEKNMNSLAKKPKNPLVSYRFCITHRESAQFILTRMLPFLKMKRVQAQDLLRFFRLFPTLQGQWTRKLSPRCGRGHLLEGEALGLHPKFTKYGRQYRYCKLCARQRSADRRAR